MTRKFLLILTASIVIFSSGCTPKEKELFEVVAAGELERTKSLLDGLVSTNFQTFDGDTPLGSAADRNFPDIVQLLVDKGADVNLLDGSGNSPLFYAAMSGCERCLTILIQKGAEFRTKGPMDKVRANARLHPSTFSILVDKGYL